MTRSSSAYLKLLTETTASNLNQVFWTNSGAEATEGAIKLAKVATGRPAIIAFRHGFHGRTHAAMAVTSSRVKVRGHYEPLIPSVYHAPFPYLFRSPYKGAPEAVTAVVRGDAQMYFAPIPSAQELGQAGKVRVMAINSGKRMPQLPDTPTVAESGLPDYKYESWFGVMAPAGTPKPVIDRLSKALLEALADPGVQKRIADVGAIPASAAEATPESFRKFLNEEIVKWEKVISEAGVAPQ